MFLRRIEQQDDKELFLLIQECLKDANLDIPGTAYFDESIKKMSGFYLNESGRDYFVLVDENNNVIGGAGFAEFNKQKKIAELQKLYINKKFRGKKLSYLLVQKVEEEAKKCGYKSLYLETHHNLPIAIQLYKKLSYTQLNHAYPESEHSTMDYFFEKQL